LQLGGGSVKYDEPPTMRGQIQQITLMNKNPQSKAEAVASKLKESGLAARIYQDQGRFVVDTDLIAEKLDAARPALQELGLQAETGLARIIIKKTD
jgi:hypothetical protein